MTTICYSDGGCSGNGTDHARAYGSWKIGGSYIAHAKFADAKTNNEAEYRTLLELLLVLKRMKIADAQINIDSRLVFEQVYSIWKVREPRLLSLVNQAQMLLYETGAVLVLVQRNEIKAVLGH